MYKKCYLMLNELKPKTLYILNVLIPYFQMWPNNTFVFVYTYKFTHTLF